MVKKIQKCHDCGITEGQYHLPGCDMERCPFCGGQLISCDCVYEILKLKDLSKYGEETSNLPPKIYSEGLTPELEEKWDKILKEKGLIPYFLYPWVCCRCGELWPEMFMVPNEEWAKYIQKDMRNSIICRKCYDKIKELTDKYKK